ncbi:hypothetical protein [Paenibacillus polymyxa]|uniref:hypothetical protein n=1 Tax=Paenibacillus polymyxa TaxID=1406 RepID=UPI00287F791B|nr:hypothetical protein [Paenibacillus polymyxa]
MKSKVMAQFLVAGDIIIHNRRKYIISNTKTIGNLTSILCSSPKDQKLHSIKQAPKSEFYTVVNDGRL